MSINVDPTYILGQVQTGATGVEPSTGDVDLFAAAMAAKASRPERVAVDAVRKASDATSARVEVAASAMPMDGDTMRNVQKALLEMRSSVDVIAKVAGTLSQSINKLTTMQ